MDNIKPFDNTLTISSDIVSSIGYVITCQNYQLEKLLKECVKN